MKKEHVERLIDLANIIYSTNQTLSDIIYVESEFCEIADTYIVTTLSELFNMDIWDFWEIYFDEDTFQLKKEMILLQFNQ